MYFKQKSDLLYFLSSSAKYVLRVINIVANQPLWKIAKFQIVQIKLDQKVA